MESLLWGAAHFDPAKETLLVPDNPKQREFSSSVPFHTFASQPAPCFCTSALSSAREEYCTAMVTDLSTAATPSLLDVDGRSANESSSTRG